MQSNVIYRQDAIDAVEKESQVDGAYGYMDTKSIVDLLSDLPSAEPKKGKWIDEGFYSDWHPHHAYRCSVCGEHIIEASFQIHEYKYCFNCGAKMEVDE